MEGLCYEVIDALDYHTLMSVIHILDTFFVPLGIFPVGNLGCFSQGKPSQLQQIRAI